MLSTGPHVPVKYMAPDARTVGDMFRRRAEHSNNRPAIYTKKAGSWEAVTWGAFYERATKVAKGLHELGLERGERVAILGPTQPPWAFYDMGAHLAGMVSLGIYPKQSVDQIRYIVDHSDTRVVFVDGADELDNVLTATAELDKVIAIVPWSEQLFEESKDRSDKIVSPARFTGEALSEQHISDIHASIDPSELAILVYTSGTTGPPKGAMIGHDNILALLGHQGQFLELFEDDLSLNFLPMAHAAERILGFYGRINSGICTAYASSIASVLDEVKEVRPTLFGSVPRLFEKAYGKIHSEAAKKSRLAQSVFSWAVSVARQAAPYRIEGREMPMALRAQYILADKAIYQKVRDAFGGRVRQFVTGAAPIALEILEFFWGAGLNVYEVYGMTEATVVTHANRPNKTKLGTVGNVLDAMEHKIAEDGEILLRGPYVFQGYFKNEEATASTIIDGWLHTGDIGSIDADGFLKITDRKKHLIITAGGKNLAPANIENAIKNQSPLISQVHAHGDKRPYVSALIAPSPIETLAFGVERDLVTQSELEERTRELMDNPSGRSEALNAAVRKVVDHPDFVERAREAVRAGNAHLAHVEQVRRFTILDRDFSQEHGELTPTMKLKRKVLETKFAELFDKVYDDDAFAHQP